MVRSRGSLGSRARPVSGESNIRGGRRLAGGGDGDAPISLGWNVSSVRIFVLPCSDVPGYQQVSFGGLDEAVVQVQNGADYPAAKKSKPYPLKHIQMLSYKKPKSELGTKIEKAYINNTIDTIQVVRYTLVIVHRLCRCLYMVPEKKVKWVPCRWSGLVGVVKIFRAMLQNPEKNKCSQVWKAKTS